MSCGKEDPSANDSVDKAEYELTITMGKDSLKLIGKNIDSNWASDERVIWLGTDEKNEPLGTLNIVYNQVSQDNIATIKSISLSKTDVKVGTSEELNSKLYHSNEGEIKIIKTASNYIHGKLEEFPMVEATSGDSVTVSGWFIAVSK